jgi:hypothetical protein
MFDFVELWLPNIENSKLKLVAYKSSISYADTYDEGKEVKWLQMAEGLPGTVWLSKSPVLWDEISKRNEVVIIGS